MILTLLIIPTNPVVITQPQQLLQQGWQMYQQEKYTEAAKTLEQAIQQLQTQKDDLNTALALNYLSLTQQQLGQLQKATTTIEQSLALLKNNSKIRAQALNIQGQLKLAQGQPEKALTSWEQATIAYKQAGDRTGEIGSKINQAQAFQILGLYRRALILLAEVKQNLEQQPDQVLKVNGLLSIGNALRVVGKLDGKSNINSLSSRQVLEQSLAASQNVPTETVAEILLSIGNTAQAQQKTSEALEFYRRAASIGSPITQLQAQQNQLHLLVEKGQWAEAQALWPVIKSQLANTSPSRKSIYTRINFAQSLICLKQNTEETGITLNSSSFCPKIQNEARNKNLQPATNPSWTEIAQTLKTAVDQAHDLGDLRTTSYALGTLGSLYEQTQQWQIAQNLTQQALRLSESIQAIDIGYRWQWQLGRILNNQHNPQNNYQGAIAAYTKSVNILKYLRSDLVASDREVQFSFREGVEPVYRELVSLLLQPGSDEPSQDNLKQARQVIESLQLAELDNYFRRACLDAQPVQIEEIDLTAAVIYPVILPDRLEVILSLPDKTLHRYTTHLPQKDLEKTFDLLRQKLVTRSSREFLPLSKQVYNWLIRPAEAYLVKNKVKNLVFVLDGSLRNIPIAALHDGQQYMLEKQYNLALTPGLQLLPQRNLIKRRLEVLLAGISESRLDRPEFSDLPGVKTELQQIKSIIPARIFLNEQFTTSAFEQAVKSSVSPIIHLATHGQFSSKAENTFILTWNEQVNVNELNSLLKTREASQKGEIELLVLSACKTADGDNRAVLGIAGVAIRSGARSTLATLWIVNDEATSVLMGDFYKHLADTNMTKAEALRRAQLTLLKDPAFKHPYFWAPYVLVGNWQ